MKKISIFYKYLLFYLALCGLVLLLSIPVYYVTLSSLRTNYNELCWNSIKQSSEEFENSINTLLQTHNRLLEDLLFLEVRNYQTEEITIKEYGKLFQMQKRFSTSVSGIYLADEIFMLFDKNDKVISKNRLYHSLSECFDHFIQYKEHNPEDIYKTLLTLADATHLNQKGLLKSTPVSLNDRGTEEYLTIATRTLSSNATICALYSMNTLLDLFDITSYPEKTFLCLETRSGNQLLTYRYESVLAPKEKAIYQIDYEHEKFTVLEKTLSDIDCIIMIGIPDSYFTNMVKPILRLINICILTIVVIGIIAALLFAFLNYKPIKRLVTMPLSENGHNLFSSKNELAYIHNKMKYMDKAYSTLKANFNNLEELIRENLFIRMLCGMIYTKEDMENVRLFIPQATESYHVVIIDISVDNNFVAIDYFTWFYYRLKEEMKKETKKETPVARINKEQIVVMLTEDTLAPFSRFICNIAVEAEKSNSARIIAGISKLNTGIANMHDSYYQAQFCIYSSTGTITHYSHTSTKKSQDIITLVQRQMLYKVIISGDADKVDNIIRETVNLLISNGSSKEEVRQVYYIIRYMYCLAIAYLELDYDCLALPQFDETISISELFERLSAACRNLCALLIETNKKDHYTELLDYIHDNYCDPNIYSGTISSVFHISTKQVFRIVRRLTGCSLTEYIDQLRMKKAMELLNNISVPINGIAEKCGYNSYNTFYRSFKKYFGISPSDYRRNN